MSQPNGDWSLDSNTVTIVEARSALASVRVLTGGLGGVSTAGVKAGLEVAVRVGRFLNICVLPRGKKCWLDQLARSHLSARLSEA